MIQLDEKITHYRIHAYAQSPKRTAYTVIILYLEDGGMGYAVFSEEKKAPVLHPGPPPKIWLYYPTERLGHVYEMLKREEPVFLQAGWPDLTSQPTWASITNTPELVGDEDMDPPALGGG